MWLRTVMTRHRAWTVAAATALAVLALGCARGSTPTEDPAGPGDGGEPGGGGAASASGGGGEASAASSGGATDGGAGAIAPGALVITEVMANPDAVTDTVGEWFEVCNVSSTSLLLDGLVLRHEASDSAALLPLESGVVIAPFGYAVLGKGLDAATNGGAPVDYLLPADLSLTNTGDYLALETTDGVIIDHTYWGRAPQGASRSLDPAFLDSSLNDDDTHFCAATSLLAAGDRGTPGAPNDPCQ